MTPFHLYWYSKLNSYSGLLQGILEGWWWNFKRCISCCIYLVYVNFKYYKLETFWIKRCWKSDIPFEKIFFGLTRKIITLSTKRGKVKDVIARLWNYKSQRNCCSDEDFRIKHFVPYCNSYKMIPSLSCVWTLRYEKELKSEQFCSGHGIFNRITGKINGNITFI